MTPEEIKKIAEEYAKELYPKEYALMQKGECDFETEEAITDCISALECHIRYLLERYYLVEKGKAISKYKEVKNLNNFCNDMFADDTAVFEYLFGSEIGKEDGDE